MKLVNTASEVPLRFRIGEVFIIKTRKSWENLRTRLYKENYCYIMSRKKDFPCLAVVANSICIGDFSKEAEKTVEFVFVTLDDVQPLIEAAMEQDYATTIP